MNLPWSVWAALVCGVMLLAWPERWRAAWFNWSTAAVVWSVLLAEILADATNFRDGDRSLRLASLVLTLLWSVGFGREVVAARGPASWGWMWLTAAAMAAIGSGRDWLTLGLAWEIVRRATAVMIDSSSATDRSRRREAMGPSLGLWTAIATWLLATGSLNLDDIAIVLQRSYVAHEPDVSLGRPALIVTAAACLTIVSLLAPCFVSPRRDLSEGRSAQVAALLARQLVAVLLLTRCCRDVFFGIEAPVSWVLLVFAAGAWLVAVRTVAQPSQLDRLWIGCSYWQLAVALTWLLVALITRTAAPGGLPVGRGVGFAAAGVVGELVHTIVVLAGATAAVRWLSRQHAPPQFLEDLQGAARDQPLWGALVLVPIASLIGVPVLIGARLRFLLYVALWSLPQAGPNDTLALHGGLMALVWISLAAWVLLAGSCLTVFRTLLWDHPLGTWEIRPDWWCGIIATAAAAALILSVWTMP